MIKNLLSLLIVIIYLFSCATVPVTGRKQISLVSNDEIITMSATEYQKVLTTSKLSTNAEQTAMIKRVGTKIQKAVEQYMAQQGKSAELQGFNWEFNLIQNDTTVNAWCMPGGKVAFYTGILPICQGEDGVAIVMGHEVSHAIANHGRERMSQQMVAQYGLDGFSLLMGQNPTAGQQLLLQAVGAGSNVGILKFSRDQESEADHIGLIFMTIAGYDPNTAPKFWERMAAMNTGSKPPEFLSTHPADATRIKDIEKWIPEALTYKK